MIFNGGCMPSSLGNHSSTLRHSNDRATVEDKEIFTVRLFFLPFPIKVVLRQARLLPASISSPVFCRPPVYHFAVDFPPFHRWHTAWRWRWGENKGSDHRVDSGLRGAAWLGPASGAMLHETQGKLNFTDKEHGDTDWKPEEMKRLRKERASQAGRD